MYRRILVTTLLVSIVTAFSPPNTAFFGVTRTSSSSHVAPYSQRLSPFYVQTSFDETTSSQQSSNVIPEFSFPENIVDNTLVLQKTINGVFLVACFGYALYAILNIDHGMTRGWSQSEIAMRIPLDNWSSYESALLEKPIFTKTIINVIIYLLGDWLSQTVFQGNNVLDFDISRTLKNGFIGLCFGPLVHEYYEFSDHILPVEGGLVNRASKILMDQTVYLTIKCSLYISAVGLLGGDSPEKVKENVKERIGPVVITAWKFWPLVHCITYGLVPARHRILWVNCVDLVWNAILASKAQGDDTDTTSQEEENVDAIVCHQDEELIQSIKTDGSDVFDASIQAELLDTPILPLPPQESVLLESSAMNASSTNCTNAVAQTA